jgi:hypothetical protein
MCKAMEWKHLPEPGGIYQQNVEFIERMMYVMKEEAKEEERKQAEENAKREREMRHGKSRRR